MSAINPNALPVVVWELFVAPYTTSITQLLNDMTNSVAVKGELDALTYSRLASITDLTVNENLTDKLVEVITDDTGTIYRAATPTITVKGNWYEVGELSVVNEILGYNVYNVAGTPVSVVAEAHGTGWTIGLPIKLNFKDGDDTIVASIVVKSGVTTLTLATDYNTYVGDGVNGELGYTYIVPVTAQAGAITVGYSYTPNDSKLSGRTITSFSIPTLVVKVVSTDESGKVNTDYLVDCGFEGELITSYLDVVRAGNITPSAFTFKGLKNGYILKYRERF